MNITFTRPTHQNTIIPARNIKRTIKPTKHTNLAFDCIMFSGNKSNALNLKPRLESIFANPVSFKGNFLKASILNTEQLIEKDLKSLNAITPMAVNNIVKKHLQHFTAKDISELPTERKSEKPVIAHRTANLPDLSVTLYLDTKANQEDVNTSIMSEVRSHLEDLEIQKTTATFREKICGFQKLDKPSIEKVIKELKLSDKVKIVDSSKEQCLDYYKQLPAVCVPDVSNPDKALSTLYINFSMSRIDIEQCTVHEFVHAQQLFKETNFFIDNKSITKNLRQQIDSSTKNLDILLQNVFNAEQGYFKVIDESELAATEKKYGLFKAAIARELQGKSITNFNNYLQYIQLWALHEAEAYKEGIITIKSNPDFIKIAQANSGQAAEHFISTKDKPVHIALELMPRYYQEFANSINFAMD